MSVPNSRTKVLSRTINQQVQIKRQHKLLTKDGNLVNEMRSQWDILESQIRGSKDRTSSFPLAEKATSPFSNRSVVATRQAATWEIGATVVPPKDVNKQQVTRLAGTRRTDKNTGLHPARPATKVSERPALQGTELLLSKEVNAEMLHWETYRDEKNHALVSLKQQSATFKVAQAVENPGSAYRIKHAIGFLCAIHAAIEAKTGSGSKVGAALDAVWSREANLQKQKLTQLEYEWQEPWKKNSIFKGQIPTGTSLQSNIMQVVNRVDECTKALKKAQEEALAYPGDKKIQGAVTFRSKELLAMRKLASKQLTGLEQWTHAAIEKTFDRHTREYLRNAEQAISDLKNELFSDATQAGSAVRKVTVPQIGRTTRHKD